MENASKALLMAGGILIAVLVLSVAVLGYTKIKSFKKTETEGILKKQITAFNREYESYNRQLLHGIDVISVVHKAVSNNESLDRKGEGDNWFVNIIIKTKGDFETTVTKVDKTKGNAEQEQSSINEYINKNGTYINSISNIKFVGLNKIGDYSQGNTKWKPDNSIINFFNQEATTLTDTIGDYTYYIYPGLVNFKSAIFKCTKVEYNNDGRVYQMTFEEVRRK